VIVFVDSLANIPSSWPLSLKMKAAVGRQLAASAPLARLAGCRHLLIDERLILLSGNPTNDDLQVAVVGGETESVLGSASLEVTQLLGQDGRLALRGHVLPLRGHVTASRTRPKKEDGPSINIRYKDIVDYAMKTYMLMGKKSGVEFIFHNKICTWFCKIRLKLKLDRPGTGEKVIA
jgi:hypothetical protein